MELINEKKQVIEDTFLEVADLARAFNEGLMKMRSIELPELEGLDAEERKTVIQMGRDLDMRTAFILRSILTQHGNVLFL